MGKKGKKKQLKALQNEMGKAVGGSIGDVPDAIKDDLVFAWQCVDLGIAAARLVVEDGCDVGDVASDLSTLVEVTTAKRGLMSLAEVIRAGVE